MKIKYWIDNRRKARIDAEARRRAFIAQQSYYIPAESKEMLYATACLQVVLLHDDRANFVYKEIVRAWGLPGCKLILEKFKEMSPVTTQFRINTLKAIQNKEPLPEIPFGEWIDTYLEGAVDNNDLMNLFSMTHDLIRIGFNREIDQINETWEVLPEKSPYLFNAILWFSLYEYRNIDLSHVNEYKKLRLDGHEFDTNEIMKSKPDSGMERLIYRKMIKTFKDCGFKSKHGDTLLHGAEKWYDAKIRYPSIRAAADHYHMDDNQLSRDIKPYQDAIKFFE